MNRIARTTLRTLTLAGAAAFALTGCLTSEDKASAASDNDGQAA